MGSTWARSDIETGPRVAPVEVEGAKDYGASIDEADSIVIFSMREIAAGIGGTDPEAAILSITLVTEMSHPLCHTGCAWPNGRVEILEGMNPGRTAVTLIHEISHVLTHGDGHGEIWCALYTSGVTQLTPAYLEYKRPC